jgi:hypothetical protein
MRGERGNAAERVAPYKKKKKKSARQAKTHPALERRDERFIHVALSLLLIGSSARHLKAHLSVSAKLCSSSPQISNTKT